MNGNLYTTVTALVGFIASALSAVQAVMQQNVDYMGALNKKASGAQ